MAWKKSDVIGKDIPIKEVLDVLCISGGVSEQVLEQCTTLAREFGVHGVPQDRRNNPSDILDCLLQRWVLQNGFRGTIEALETVFRKAKFGYHADAIGSKCKDALAEIHQELEHPSTLHQSTALNNPAILNQPANLDQSDTCAQAFNIQLRSRTTTEEQNSLLPRTQDRILPTTPSNCFDDCSSLKIITIILGVILALGFIGMVVSSGMSPKSNINKNSINVNNHN